MRTKLNEDECFENDNDSDNGDGDGDECSYVSSDGEYIAEGDCELCERIVKITKHHLIPRSTWPRFKTRLLNALDAMQGGDDARARVILGGMLTPDELVACSANLKHKRSIKSLLQRTCNFCRLCHNAVHRTHDNMTLAEQYNSVDKLLMDPAIIKFGKWCSIRRLENTQFLSRA